MAVKKHRDIHVEHTKKMTLLITCNITFSQHVSEVFYLVPTWCHMFDLDFGVQIEH